MKGVDICDPNTDPMPPPDSNIQLSQMDIAMVEAWIMAGAPGDN